MQINDKQFEVVIRMHSEDAPKVLSDPEEVRFMIGYAFDRRGLQEEIDYTLEVKRLYLPTEAANG